MSPSSLRFALPFLVLAGAACSAGVEDETTTAPSPPATTTTTSTGEGGQGAGTGTGGEGGEPMEFPCGQDCSLIQTQPCFESVCNTGQYAGAVGSCTVVPAEAGTTCDDGEFCTVDDACDGEGVCAGGGPNDCGMTASECNEITCNETDQQCEEQPLANGTQCTSSDLCQAGTTCTNGVCGGGMAEDCFLEPVPNECFVSECNPSNGQCEPVPGNDGGECTDLNDLCTEGKTCSAGTCMGGAPKDCSGFSEAVGCLEGVCDTNTGQCTTQALSVGDPCDSVGDDCNAGMCDANNNCVAMPVADGTACTDFNSCTTGNTCTAGVCGTLDSACTIFLEEGFEACPPAGWTFGPVWECGAPGSSGPSTTAAGANIAGTDLNANYPDGMTYATNYIESPPVDLTTTLQPELTWQDWVNTENGNFDGYHVEVSTDNGSTWNTVTTVSPPYNATVASEPAYSGDQSTSGWTTKTADLSAFNGQVIILRFAMRSDTIINDPGVFIDEVRVEETTGPTVPLAIETIAIADVFVGATLSQTLQRTGGSAAAEWSIVGGTNSGWLSIGQATGVLTGTPAAGNLGAASVTIRIEEPGTNPLNFDEVTFNFEVVDLPYVEDFEDCANLGWLLNSSWECGAPTSGPSAAESGTNVLATVLGGNYTNNLAWDDNVANAKPLALPPAATLGLSFRVWYNTEGNTWDGWNVKVSTDGGQTFTLVTAVNPTYPLTVSTQSCWGGDESAAGYQTYTADLSAFAGQTVILQYAMRTDGSAVRPGVYIDDVTLQ